MKTVARLSAEDRSDLFRNTANRMQMSDAVVEKDFWVCFTLDYQQLISRIDGVIPGAIQLSKP